MPNIASILKSEISRVARKEARTETAGIKKASSTHRTEIAALKRRLQALEQELRRVSKASGKLVAQQAEAEPEPQTLRFSAKALSAQRKRLGLSAEDCGLLVGASAQSVYNWESGEVRPRAKHLAAIAGLRKMGKRQVAAQLESLRAPQQ
jgi:DNA-binding transcriptional regulator YiaG